MNQNPAATVWRWAALLVLVVAAVWVWQSGAADGLTLGNLKVRQADLLEWVTANAWLAAGLFFLAYVAVAAASMPGAAVMTLAAGALFGLLWGTLLVSFASAIGATLAFWWRASCCATACSGRFGERLKTIDAGHRARRRVLPLHAAPGAAVPVLPDQPADGPDARCRLRTFYWVSQLGMLAGTLVYVYAGTQLAQIDRSPTCCRRA